jgi:hypothetical protein
MQTICSWKFAPIVIVRPAAHALKILRTPCECKKGPHSLIFNRFSSSLWRVFRCWHSASVTCGGKIFIESRRGGHLKRNVLYIILGILRRILGGTEMKLNYSSVSVVQIWTPNLLITKNNCIYSTAVLRQPWY